MNPRERILAACVVGIVALGGLWMVVQWGVIARWKNLDTQITQTASREKKLIARRKQARRAIEDWGSIRPLAHNEEIGAQRFRVDVSRLLDEHGLSANCTIRKLPARTLKATGFTEVRLSVTTRGTLRQVLELLCDFYRREYPARLESINLTAVESRRSSRRVTRGRPGVSRRGAEPEAVGPDGPQLNISLTATALVLPESRDVAQPAIEQLEPEEGAGGRLPRNRDEYELVLDKNLFKLWTPERPTHVAQNDREPEVDKPDTPTPPPPVEPRPRKTLVGVTSTRGELAAYVRDEDRLDLEPEKLRINDQVDDGTVVLVYPRGMVVQVAEEQGEAFECRYYVYELGALFEERTELDPQRHPDLQRALELALIPQ